jgi:hypothetical protein
MVPETLAGEERWQGCKVAVVKPCQRYTSGAFPPIKSNIQVCS